MNSSTVTSEHRPPCAFSTDGSYLLFSTAGGQKVLVCDEKGEVVCKLHVGASHAAAVHVATVVSKKKGEQCFGVVGTMDGKIMMFDLKTGESTQTFNAHDQRISAITSHKKILYTSSGKEVCRWNLLNGKKLKSWSTDQACRALAVNTDGTNLAIATARVQIMDVNTSHEVNSLSGHGSSITSVTYMPDDRFLATASSSDRSVMVWKARDASDCVATYMAHSPVLSLTVCKGKKGSSRLLTTASSSVSQVFDFVAPPTQTVDVSSKSTKKKSKKSSKHTSTQNLKPIFTISAVNGEQRSADISNGAILTGVFSSYKVLLVARLAGAWPSVQSVKVSSSPDSITLPPLQARTLTSDNSQEREKRKIEASNENADPVVAKRRKLASQLGAKILGTSDLPSTSLSQSTPQASTTPSKKSKRNTDNVEHTFEEKLAQLSQRTAPRASHDDQQRPTAGTLTALLVQALGSKDKEKLNQCLQETNEAVIQATLEKLPLNKVVPFLTEITVRIQSRPQTAAHLGTWLKCCLACHASFLMGVSSEQLEKCLGALYRSIDARLRVFGRLLRLSGRLELVFKQGELAQRFVQPERFPEPEAVYTGQESESESEGDEIME